MLFSCTSKQYNNIIPRDKMIHILADLHKTDALVMYAVNRNKIRAQDSKYYYVGLFKKYNITKEDFDSSYNYYCSNMSDFEKMYNEVIIKLTKQKDSLNYVKKKVIKRN